MSERHLRSVALIVLSTLGAMLIGGTIWRAVVTAPAHGAAASRSADGSRSGGVVRRVVIEPGWRAEQVAQALARAEIVDEKRFLDMVFRPGPATRLLPDRDAGSFEGYLFPGTYEFTPGTLEADVIIGMVNRFKEEYTPALERRAEELGLSTHEVVTLASIVEREAALAAEMPIMAGVFLNRLGTGMPLASDATVAYAIDTRQKRRKRVDYWKRIVVKNDVTFPSRYNTYLHPGLPPGPIAAPSIDALNAVVSPAETDHLYFVGKGDRAHVFARTAREHDANVERYIRDNDGETARGSDLKRLIERVMGPIDAHVGVAVKHLVTGEEAYLNARDYFSTASVYKLLVMDAAFHERERGRLSFDNRITISQDALGHDGGEIQARLGVRPTIRHALKTMIAVSSNAAGLTLKAEIGPDNVNRLLRAQGLRDTWLREPRPITTPRDIAHLLELIARGRAVSKRASAEMVQLLLGQELNNRLPRFLPKRIRIAHKTGSVAYPSHDAGIIYARSGPIVVVVLTEEASDRPAATESIGRLAKAVVDYFDRYKRVAARAERGASRACPENPFRPRGRGPLSGRTIALDPGDGGRTPGATYSFTDGFRLLEKDVTLAVARSLKDLLTRNGATVFLTRCRDASLSPMARAAIANGIDPDILVSLHLSASERPRDNGTRVRYFSREGEALANYLLGSFAVPALWHTLSAGHPLPNHGRQRDQLDVLAFANSPSALTESVFLTNPTEAAALRKPASRQGWRREQIARGHLIGILNYFRARALAGRGPDTGFGG